MVMIFARWHIVVAMTVVALAATARGQSTVHWSSYKIADGLSEPAFNSVTFTPQGRLIATSLQAPLASELDGYSVSNFPAPAGNAGRIAESPGGQHWAVDAQGLLELKNSAWVRHPVREIARAATNGWRPDFLPVRQGCVLFLLPDGLMEFSVENPDRPRTTAIMPAAKARIGAFTGMALARDGGLWISGTHGLAHAPDPVRNLAPDAVLEQFLPPVTLPAADFSDPEPDENGGVILLADAVGRPEKMAVDFDRGDWTALPAGPRNFFRAWRGPDGDLRAVTGDALFQWVAAETNWVENENILPGQISDVAIEPGGAFWLATADGLFRCAASLWARPEPLRDFGSPVAGLALDEQGELCFLAGGWLHRLKERSDRVIALPAGASHALPARALVSLKDGSLLADMGNQLWQIMPDSGAAKLLAGPNPTAPVTLLGMLPDGGAGLYHAGPPARLDEFDGSGFHPLPNPPVLRPENDPLTTLFSARNGDLWLGGRRDVLWFHHDRWQRFASADDAAPENATAFAELPDGKIWCATPDKLWEFDGQNWLLLQTRFNRVNALLVSRAGEVWLASNGGAFRLRDGVWLDYGLAEGLPNGAVFDLCEDAAGHLCAATARGLCEFHPEADSDPPRAGVRPLAGENLRLVEGGTLNLLFDGGDKWKYSGREELLFSYQLDHLGWSPFRNANGLALPGLTAGGHSLQVRAMDRTGNVGDVPAALDFAVVTPWFREARLWVVLVLGLAAAVFFAAVAWQRHRQLIRSHAAVEQKVAERTRELEIATRELLHSQKMNALGTLAAGIAHDFNNILSIIKGSAQIIEDNPHQPEKIRTRVDRIKTVVQQGAEIVDAMLGFSRGSDAPAAPSDINAVVADTLKLLGDRFLREVEVRFDRAEDLPELPVSREFIQQILINLIFNAAEAMTGRKKITLATRVVDRLPAEVVLKPVAAAGFVLISVSDRGGGIPPEVRPRIFEPFFTTKALSARRGTGLGLSMVYELAKKMGAGLAVQSVVGEGSVFTVILPVPAVPVVKGRGVSPVDFES